MPRPPSGALRRTQHGREPVIRRHQSAGGYRRQILYRIDRVIDTDAADLQSLSAATSDSPPARVLVAIFVIPLSSPSAAQQPHGLGGASRRGTDGRQPRREAVLGWARWIATTTGGTDHQPIGVASIPRIPKIGRQGFRKAWPILARSRAGADRGLLHPEVLVTTRQNWGRSGTGGAEKANYCFGIDVTSGCHLQQP
jgi:hypothetical protein